MPEFIFSYSGDNNTMFSHGVTAEDKADAFEKKDAYLASIKGEYLKKSMKIFHNNAWKPVPDPPEQAHAQPETAAGAAHAST